MLAKNYDSKKHRVLGWWWSEKLDGVRAIYTPDGRFWTRNGKELMAPWSFVGPMMKHIKLGPSEMLDGELYLGRGNFNECSGTVRRKDDQMWSGITYQVFDLIKEGTPFDLRYNLLADLIECRVNHVEIVSQHRINSVEDIEQAHSEIVQANGEGLMLKRPNSMYQHKRSSDLLKVKSFHEMEVICEGWTDGKGKYEGMIGALQCRLPNGATVDVGSGLVDSQRMDPPGNYIDKKITVKYFELSKDGIPRFPIFKGIRFDA